MIRWTGFAFALLLLAACGEDTAGEGASGASSDQVIRPYDVVSLNTQIGGGTQVSITGARITTDGKLQVLLEGFACGAPTKLEVEESSSQIGAVAYGARYDDDANCTANIVPWFVTVHLKEPMGERTLVDAEGQEISVSDCASDPSSALCDPPNAG